jgi:hypothetical protein
MACLLPGKPTTLSPVFVKPTTDGVVLLPSALLMTLGSLPSITATHEFVVPKSIPITLAIVFLLYELQPIAATVVLLFCFQLLFRLLPSTVNSPLSTVI